MFFLIFISAHFFLMRYRDLDAKKTRTKNVFKAHSPSWRKPCLSAIVLKVAKTMRTMVDGWVIYRMQFKKDVGNIFPQRYVNFLEERFVRPWPIREKQKRFVVQKKSSPPKALTFLHTSQLMFGRLAWSEPVGYDPKVGGGYLSSPRLHVWSGKSTRKYVTSGHLTFPMHNKRGRRYKISLHGYKQLICHMTAHPLTIWTSIFTTRIKRFRKYLCPYRYYKIINHDLYNNLFV